MDWIIAGIIVAIAAALAAQRSSYLVDYVVIVYVFNRGLRRVLDYYAGSFNPFSPVSLTPLLVTGLMLIPFLQRFGTLPKVNKTIFYCLFIAIGYAFIIGFFRIQFAAVYALAEVLAPIAMFGYILTLSPTSNTKDRWLRTSAWCAIGAAAYGWYQYFTIPPWDAFWVRAVGFEGYLGILEPTKMTVFSTMAERGVLGGFLGFAVVPMILASKWRPLSWFGVVLVLSVILLAGTRTGLILAAISTMVYVMVNRGTGFWQLALGLIVISVAGYFGMGAMPGSEDVQKRFSTLGNMQEDGSYLGRVEIYQDSVGAILTNPIGERTRRQRHFWPNQYRRYGHSVRDRGCGLCGNCHAIRLAWSSAYNLCAVAHVAGDGKALPSGIPALRVDARQGIHDRLGPGLFRRERDHHIFDSLDRVWGCT